MAVDPRTPVTVGVGQFAERIDDPGYRGMSAVDLATEAEALGIDGHDPRGLTLTGGLPYFGGPGNGYSLHGIAETVAEMRDKPG